MKPSIYKKTKEILFGGESTSVVAVDILEDMTLKEIVAFIAGNTEDAPLPTRGRVTYNSKGVEIRIDLDIANKMIIYKGPTFQVYAGDKIAISTDLPCYISGKAVFS